MNDSLEGIAKRYNPDETFDSILFDYNLRVAKEHIAGKKFLELGCSTGSSTVKLARIAESLDVVEGSVYNLTKTNQYIENLGWVGTIRLLLGLWEDYDFPKAIYSDIFFFRGLEHVEDPETLLLKLRSSLEPEGRLHIVVPNAYSLHRQIGVKMGLIGNCEKLSQTDIDAGHKMVYSVDSLYDLLRDSKYRVMYHTGVLLKPLPNVEMLNLYEKNPGYIEGFFRVGEDYDTDCAELYFCAEPK